MGGAKSKEDDGELDEDEDDDEDDDDYDEEDDDEWVDLGGIETKWVEVWSIGQSRLN